MRSDKKLFAIIFLTVFIIQAAVYFTFQYLDKNHDLDGNPDYAFPIHGQDSPEFFALAQNLKNNGSFSLDGVNAETFRTPGYPFFVSFFQNDSGSLSGAVFAQIILSALSAILIFLIAQKFLNRKLAALSAFIFGLWPSTIFHSVILLPDMPFVFFLLASIYLLFFVPERNFKTLALGGISLGVAALLRPVAIYLPIVLILFMAFETIKYHVPWRRAGVSITLFLLGFLIAVAPWIIRNRLATGTLIFSSVSAYNFARYNIPEFLAFKYGPDSREVLDYREKIEAASPEQARSTQYSSEAKKISQLYLKENIVNYSIYHLASTAKFFLSSSIRYLALQFNVPELQSRLGLSSDSPDILSALAHKDFPLVLKTLRTQTIISLDRALMIFVTVLTLAALFIKKHRFYVLLFLVIIIYFALLTGPVAIPRYRLPVEPFLIILAIHALSFGSALVKKRGALDNRGLE